MLGAGILYHDSLLAMARRLDSSALEWWSETLLAPFKLTHNQLTALAGAPGLRSAGANAAAARLSWRPVERFNGPSRATTASARPSRATDAPLNSSRPNFVSARTAAEAARIPEQGGSSRRKYYDATAAASASTTDHGGRARPGERRGPARTGDSPHRGGAGETDQEAPPRVRVLSSRSISAPSSASLSSVSRHLSGDSDAVELRRPQELHSSLAAQVVGRARQFEQDRQDPAARPGKTFASHAGGAAGGDGTEGAPVGAASSSANPRDGPERDDQGPRTGPDAAREPGRGPAEQPTPGSRTDSTGFGSHEWWDKYSRGNH
ncbi:MAG: hypothetical protein HY078_03815 [Elusimicrobia bacterium]|nr:hypothetical protein [Elusimicrobiota bacterium]